MNSIEDMMKHPYRYILLKDIRTCWHCKRMMRCWNGMCCCEWSSIIPDDCDMKTEYQIRAWNNDEEKA